MYQKAVTCDIFGASFNVWMKTASAQTTSRILITLDSMTSPRANIFISDYVDSDKRAILMTEL